MSRNIEHFIFLNLDDESTTATEDEDDIRARELRKQEVWLKNPTRSSDTDSGSETEVKISQDSVDNIIQESLILPVQISNLMSPQEVYVNDSDVDQDIGAEDMQKSPDKILMIDDDTLVGNIDQGVTNDVKFGNEEDTYRDKACGSLIPLSDSPNLTLDNRESNILNSDSFSILSNPVQNNSNNINRDNIDESISEYESLVDESGLPNQKIQKESLSKNNQVSTFNDIISNTSNNNIISLNESLDKVNNIDNELTEIIIHNETNDKVMPGLDITLSETNNKTKLQTAFAGIMLPDAIPLSQASYDNTIRPNTEEIVSFKEKLPDLITSSPNCSRESSPSSLSEIYKSTGTLYDETLISDKMTAEETEIYDSDSTRNYRESTNDDKLKLLVRKRIPIVTVTSPSPTNEKSLEEAFETAKLTVPKEIPPCNQTIQSDGNSSFDKLKRDLKQRKARNKIPVGELRPLSTENAREKMNIYFTNEKNPKPKKDQNVVFPRKETSPNVKVIELDVKPKLSNKVETKDIMKYFQKAKPEFSEKSNYKLENQSNGSSEIDKEFEEIKQRNEEIFSIDVEDIESKLHLNVLPMRLKVESIDEQSNVEKCELERNCVNKENVDSNNFSQNELREKRSNDMNVEQTPLSVKRINNILNTKSEKDATINFTPNELPLTNDISEMKLYQRKTDNAHSITDNNAKATLSTPQLVDVIKTNKNILHASDDTLNMRKNVADKTALYKNSKSSSELTLPVEQITKVKIVEQNIEVPKRVTKTNTNNNNLILSNEIPKKPERKHGSSLSSNVQNVPNVPVRRKFLKQKANVTPPFEESTNNVQLNSTKINERLINEGSNNVRKNNSLKYSTETSDSNSEIDTTFNNTLNNVTDKHSQVAKSLPLISSNQRESTKSISFKNDRTKKDKCIVS